MSKEEFKIRFNKGKDAIKKVLNEIIFDEKPYMILGGEIGCILFEKENMRFVHLANKLKIKARVLTAKAGELFVGKYEEIRFIPYRSSYSIYIWNNKVAYIFWHEPYFSLVIHNKTLYENHKNLFDLLWDQATIPKKGEVKIIDS
ncbi:MAG: hypothetical protein GXN99_00830 [Candidatus Nanohaloarchaeota archaeon]|nr:hypothetical protein [Candidatus Nanohaloarchaeota archaeon]